MGSERYFDISRKIIAAMTTEGWKNVPHASVLLDADVGLLRKILKDHNHTHSESISLNSAMLKVLSEGLNANPGLNGHIH